MTHWSIWWDECQGCGTTTKKHRARGLCDTCYEKARSRNPDRILTKARSDAKWRAKQKAKGAA